MATTRTTRTAVEAPASAPRTNRTPAEASARLKQKNATQSREKSPLHVAPLISKSFLLLFFQEN